MKRIPIISFLLVLCILSACRKDQDIIDVITVKPDPEILAEAIRKGQIIDEAGDPIQGATVSLAGTTAQTDIVGRFEFPKLTSKQNATIKVTKEGYFDNAVVSYAQGGGRSYATVQLTEKGTAKTFDASAGALLTLPDGSSANFQANSIKTQSGSPYTGTANLYTNAIDPAAANFIEKMPGELTGKNSEGKLVGLEAFAMLTLDLEDGSGEDLAVDSPPGVEVSFEVPTSLQADAPQTLELWFFDPEALEWEKRGICSLQPDGQYKANCTPGTWACCRTMEVVHVYGNVLLDNGSPAPYLKVVVDDFSTPFRYSGYTDSLGFYCGYVTKGVPLDISIIDFCVNTIYTDNIGSYNDPVNQVADINLPNTFGSVSFEALGSLSSCDNIPLDNQDGYLIIKYLNADTRWDIVDANGAFSILGNFFCQNFPALSITGYDRNTKKQSEEYVIYEDGVHNLGSLTACLAIQDSMLFTLETTPHFLFPVLARSQGTKTTITGNTFNGYAGFTIEDYNGVGVYSSLAAARLEGEDLLGLVNDVTVTITNDSGQYIIGTASGTLTNTGTQATKTFETSFWATKEL